MLKVVCIGSGYVGSVTGAAFAAMGYPTTVIDVNQAKVDLMNQGKSPIYEPGLDELIASLIGKTLFATTSYDAVREADVVFIAVGTPSKEDGNADLVYIKEAAACVGRSLNPDRFTVVVNKSTVPVGTAGLVSSIVERASGLQAERSFTVVSNPEFLREGYALEDVFYPDRIVIGTQNEQGRAVMRKLYAKWLSRDGYEAMSRLFRFPHDARKSVPAFFETDPASAEMIKYAANAFLAVKISYINEIARLCEALGANVKDVASGMGTDSRIGGKFLEVSSGWSGSCFPKDTAELLATSQRYGSELSIVKSAVESNRRMHDYVVDKLRTRLKSMNGKTVGIWGLTFKPNTDDARQTQASHIVERLLQLGAHVQVHDPQGMEMFKAMNPKLAVDYCETPYDAAERADAVVLLTHWQQYQALDWAAVVRRMHQPYLLDTRNVLDDVTLALYGIASEGLGLGSAARTAAVLEATSPAAAANPVGQLIG